MPTLAAARASGSAQTQPRPLRPLARSRGVQARNATERA